MYNKPGDTKTRVTMRSCMVEILYLRLSFDLNVPVGTTRTPRRRVKAIPPVSPSHPPNVQKKRKNYPDAERRCLRCKGWTGWCRLFDIIIPIMTYLSRLARFILKEPSRITITPTLWINWLNLDKFHVQFWINVYMFSH